MIGCKFTQIHFRIWRLLQQLKRDQAWMLGNNTAICSLSDFADSDSIRRWQIHKHRRPKVRSVGCKWSKHNTVCVQKRGQQGINSPADETRNSCTCNCSLIIQTRKHTNQHWILLHLVSCKIMQGCPVYNTERSWPTLWKRRCDQPLKSATVTMPTQ